MTGNGSPEDRGETSGKSDNRDAKRSSAEILSDILSDESVRRVKDYVRGEDFKADRQRVRRNAGKRIQNLRNRYRGRNRSPEDVVRERELTLQLAEVEAETAAVRLKLSELLEEEVRLRREISEL